MDTVTGKIVKPITSLDPIFPGWLCPAVQGGSFVFVSGVVGVHPDTGEIAINDVENQIRHILASMKRILDAYGATLDNLIKMNVYFIDLHAHLPILYSVCGKVFRGQLPIITAVGVANLAEGAMVAADAISTMPHKREHGR